MHKRQHFLSFLFSFLFFFLFYLDDFKKKKDNLLKEGRIKAQLDCENKMVIISRFVCGATGSRQINAAIAIEAGYLYISFCWIEQGRFVALHMPMCDSGRALQPQRLQNKQSDTAKASKHTSWDAASLLLIRQARSSALIFHHVPLNAFLPGVLNAAPRAHFKNTFCQNCLSFAVITVRSNLWPPPTNSCQVLVRFQFDFSVSFWQNCEKLYDTWSVR